MRIVIPGEPIAKERPRFNRTTGNFYTPASTRAYEETIAFLAMAQREKIEFEPVRFHALFYTAKKNPSDIDNLTKAIWDGLNGHAFTDDKQICEAHIARVRSSNPRVEILVEECEERVEEET